MGKNSDRLREIRSSEGVSNGSTTNSDKLKQIRLQPKIGLDTLDDDIRTLNQTIDSTMSGWQSQNDMIANRSAIRNMVSRLGDVQEYNRAIGSPTDFSGIINSYNDVLNGWDDLTSYYGTFKNADAFNSSVKMAQMADKYKGLKYDEVQKHLAESAPGSLEEKFFKGYTGYDDINEFKKAADAFDAKAPEYKRVNPVIKGSSLMAGYTTDNHAVDDFLAGASPEEREMREAYNRYALDHKSDLYKHYEQNADYEQKSQYAKRHDPFYEAINGNIKGGFDRTNGAQKTAYDIGQKMTDEEKQTYNYIYSTEGAEKAKAYVDDIEVQLDKRVYDENAPKLEEYVDKGFIPSVIASAGSVPANMLGGAVGTLDEIGRMLQGKEVNPYSNARTFSNFAQDTRQYVGENLAEKYPNANIFGVNVPSMLYQTGMSIADSVAGVATLGEAYTPLMGGSAFLSRSREMKEQGASDAETRLESVASGIFEGLFEKYSVEHLLDFKNVDGLKRGLIEAAKQAGVEGSEELFTEIANITFNTIARGNMSDLAQQIRELQTRGYSDAQIAGELAKTIGLQLGEATVGGMLSGGVMGGGSSLVTGMRNSNYGKQIRSVDRQNALFDMAANMSDQESETYKYYTELANKGKTADTATNTQVGALYSTMGNDLINAKADTDEDFRRVYDDRMKYSTLTKEKSDIEKRADALAKNAKEDSEKTEVTGIKHEGDETILITNNGEVKAEDANLSRNQAAIVSYAETIEDNDMANLFIESYDGEMDADQYASSFRYLSAYGMTGRGLSDFGDDFGSVSADVATKIYEGSRKISLTNQQNKVDAINAKYASTEGFFGKFDDSIIDYKGNDKSKVSWASLTSRQRDAVNFARAFSKVTGTNITFIRGGESRKIEGKTSSLNRTIYVDIEAGLTKKNIEDSIIPTMSHEMTHLLKASAPQTFARVQDIVLDTIARDGYDINQTIYREMERMRKAHPETADKVTEQGAIDEIVARACEDMLANSNAGRKMLFNMSEEDRNTLVGKMKQAINNLVNWVNDLLKLYKSNSEEAILMRQYKDSLKELSKAWDETLKEVTALQKKAAEVNAVINAVGLTYDAEQNIVIPDDYVQESRKTWENSFKTDDEIKEGYELSPKEYRERMRQAAEEVNKALGLNDIKKAERYIRNINSIARLIAKDAEIRDYDSNVDENASALKANSEYTWSIDMSTLCKKRLLTTGTFDAIQTIFRDTAFTSEDLADLRSLMNEKGYEVACAICYVESTRRELGAITQSFIDRYKVALEKGTNITRINSKGQEVDLTKDSKKIYAEDGYIPTLADLNTTKIDWVKINHPAVYDAYLAFMNARGQAKPKLLETRTEYKNEIVKKFEKTSTGKLHQTVKKLNSQGGLILQSFSDFEIVHMIDMMQILMDMSKVGFMSQAYTKVPEFADIFGRTGVKINLSLMAKGVGYDENGNLIFDDIEGMPAEQAFALRKKYSANVGTILVGKNDRHIQIALADPRIDYVIPFHKSSWKESLYEKLGMTGYSDYTEYQNEKKPGVDGLKNFYPMDWWLQKEDGTWMTPYEAQENYLRMCKEDGRIPKFTNFLDYNAETDTYSIKEGWENYWKLLIDFKMLDNAGNFAPQTVVRPEFNMSAARRVMKAYKGGHRQFAVATDVVEEFSKGYREAHPDQYVDEDEYSKYANEDDDDVQFSDRRDAEYLELAKDPEKNEARLREMVYEEGAKKGFTERLFHGTNDFGFTKIDVSQSDDGKAFFATDSLAVARTYSNNPQVRGLNVSDEEWAEFNSTFDTIMDEVSSVASEIASAIEDLDAGYATESYIISFFDEEFDGYSSKMDSPFFRRKIGKSVDETFEKLLSKDESYKDKFMRIFDLYVEASEVYGNENGGNYDLLCNTSNALEVDAHNDTWNTIKLSGDMAARFHESDLAKYVSHFGGDGSVEVSTRGLAEYASVTGNDVIKIKNVFDDGGNSIFAQTEPATVYIFLNPQRDVKSADPVTYDDNGNIIPLSERFNEYNDDIRFADRNMDEADLFGGVEALQKQNAKLLEDVNRLKERLRLERTETGGKVLNSNHVLAEARRLKAMSNSNIDTKVLVDLLKDMYNYILTADEVDGNAVLNKSYDIASRLFNQQKDTIEYDPFYDEIKADLKRVRVRLNEAQIAEAKSQYGSNWRRVLGRYLRIDDNARTTLDSFWSDTLAPTYPSVFDAELSDAQQGVEIVDIMRSVNDGQTKHKEYTDTNIKREWAAEAYNGFWNVSTITTVADRNKAKIDKLKAEHRKAMRELRESFDTKTERLNAEIRNRGEIIRNLKSEKRQAVLDQKKADDIYYGGIINKLREERRKDVAEAKISGKKKLEDYKDRQERNKYIKRITDDAKDIAKWFDNKDKNVRVPKIMRESVAYFIQAIDFSSKRLLGMTGGDAAFTETKKDISIAEALKGIYKMVVKVEESNISEEMKEEMGTGLYIDLAPEVKEYLDKIVEDVEELKKEFGDNEYVLNRMSAEDLKTLSTCIKALKKSIRNMNEFYGLANKVTVTEMGKKSMDYMDGLGEYKGSKEASGKRNFLKMIKWGNANPYFAFRRFGEVGEQMFESLQDGWDKFAFRIAEISDFTIGDGKSGLYTEAEYDKWSKDIRQFDILVKKDYKERNEKPQYKTVSMTVPQIMSLYCLSKREQARGHIFGGGISIGTIDVKNGALKKDTHIERTRPIPLTETELQKIISVVESDARLKAVADGLQNFMATRCAEWGNEVTMTRWGIEGFGEENYFPIKSDSDSLSSEANDNENSLFRLLNMGFTKALVANANNAIQIDGIFDVFSQHSSDMAKYNALALPILNAFKWFSYKEKIAQGGKDSTQFDTKSVKSSMRMAFGGDANSYVTTFLRDLNGEHSAGRIGLSKAFVGNAKIAAVGFNIRVALLQPTSMFRAMAVLDSRLIAKSLATKNVSKGYKQAIKHCGLALWKDMGFFDINVQRRVTDIIKGEKSFKDKFTELAMKGAEKGDAFTVGVLWNACEMEVKMKHKDLTPGTDEFYTAVGKKLREVIYKTQVVDSTMTRSQMMRSKDGLDQLTTAFMSEATLSYNLVMDSVYRFNLAVREYMGKGMSKADAKRKAVSVHGKEIANNMKAYFITAAVAALVEGGFDWMRDKDKDIESLTAEEVAKLWLKNFRDDISVSQKIPIVKELVSKLLNGYSSSRQDTAWADYVVSTWEDIGKIKSGKGNAYKTAKDAVRAFSTISGMPIYNILRDADALFDKAGVSLEDIVNDVFGE